MIWNYVETAGLLGVHVSLHLVFRNLVALVITSGETMWDYRELQVSRKLEHGPRHYNYLPSRMRTLTSTYRYRVVLAGVCMKAVKKPQRGKP